MTTNQPRHSAVRTDPRGPFRTVESVEHAHDDGDYGSATFYAVTYRECGHVGRLSDTMAPPAVGEQVRCFACAHAR